MHEIGQCTLPFFVVYACLTRLSSTGNKTEYYDHDNAGNDTDQDWISGVSEL